MWGVMGNLVWWLLTFGGVIYTVNRRLSAVEDRLARLEARMGVQEQAGR